MALIVAFLLDALTALLLVCGDYLCGITYGGVIMDLTNITLTQIAIWGGSVLAGMLIGSLLVPKPVKGGLLSILLGGIIGAVTGAIIATQAFAVTLAGLDWSTVGSFFLGALVGVLLVKLLLQESRRFKTESRS